MYLQRPDPGLRKETQGFRWLASRKLVDFVDAIGRKETERKGCMSFTGTNAHGKRGAEL